MSGFAATLVSRTLDLSHITTKTKSTCSTSIEFCVQIEKSDPSFLLDVIRKAMHYGLIHIFELLQLFDREASRIV